MTSSSSPAASARTPLLSASAAPGGVVEDAPPPPAPPPPLVGVLRGAALQSRSEHRRQQQEEENLQRDDTTTARGTRAGPTTTAVTVSRRRGTVRTFWDAKAVWLRVVAWGNGIAARLAGRALPFWRDPRNVGAGVGPKHTKLRLFTDARDALACGLMDGAPAKLCSARALLLDTFPTHTTATFASSSLSPHPPQWRFHLYDCPAEVPKMEFVSTVAFQGSGSEAWGEPTQVPSQWQLAHPSWEDPPIYSNFTYPMSGRWTNLSTAVPTVDNPTGVYRCVFSLPQSWTADDHHAFDYVLILHGVGSCAEVFLNSVRIGHCTDSMTEAEFDVSAALLAPPAGGAARASGGAPPEPHVLALMVPRFSAASYLEDQDMWRLSGIHRSVELQRRPRALHMWDYEAVASYERGTIELTVEVLTATTATSTTTTTGDSAAGGGQPPPMLRATLYEDSIALKRHEVLDFRTGSSSRPGSEEEEEEDLHETRFRIADRVTVPISCPVPGIAPTAHTSGTPAGRTRHVVSLKMYIRDALQQQPGSESRLLSWSPEFPNLYPLILEVLDAAGVVQQVEVCRVGFRDVGMSGSGQLTINGRVVTVCGVNRHEFSDATGKVITEEAMVQDVTLLKRNNFNAVRCSHYPNHARWYELCDHYGLWVCDEANVETHGFVLGGALSLLQFDTRFREAIVGRARNMVLRSRNHACVVMWSLGNESGFGPNMWEAARVIRALDDSRVVHYEGGMVDGTPPMFLGDGQDPVSDVICPMYHTPEQISRYGKNDGDRRPVILCEYAHAMGNSCGGLHLYWNLFRSSQPEHERLQGGFIWDWVDQGLLPLAITSAVASPAATTTTTTTTPATTAAAAVAGKRKSSLSMQFSAKPIWKYGGDFGEGSGEKDAQFCCNGLVFPDRTPHPALFETKYLMQPFRFSLEDLVERVVVVGCRNFSCLTLTTIQRDLVFTFDATDGRTGEMVCEAREFTLDEAPGASATGSGYFFQARLRFNEAVDMIPEVVFIRVWASLRHNKSYASAGHVVAHDAFEVEGFGSGFRRVVPDPRHVLPITAVVKPSPPNAAAAAAEAVVRASLVAVADGYVAKTRVYTARVDDKTGGLSSLKCNDDGVELLRAPVTHSFYRAPTDNDLGGAEAHVSSALLKRLVPESTRSHASTWKRAGLHELRCRVDAMEMDHTTPAEGGRDAPTVLCRATYLGGGRGDVPLFEVETAYTFLPQVVSVRVFVRGLPALKKAKVKSLPRVGLCVEVSETLSQVTYLGRGPHENYPDRKESAKMGVYDTSVDAMHVPYIFPSENGGRADVRWLSCRDPLTGSGVQLTYSCEDAPPKADVVFTSGEPEVPGKFSRPVGTRGAQVSVSRFSVSELEAAKHQSELSHSVTELPSKSVKVHVDTAFMGLGGDVSWLPSTHPCYFVDPLAGAGGGEPSSWTYQVDVRPLLQGSAGVAVAVPVPVAGRAPGSRGVVGGWRV